MPAFSIVNLILTLVTNGLLSKVEHFETKAEVATYATSIGLPSTFYLPGFYMSNLPGNMLRQDESGKYMFALPVGSDGQIPFIDAANDTGKYVKAIFENRDKLLGKEVLAAVKYYTPVEVVEAFTKAFPKAGEGAHYVTVTKEQYQGILQGAGMPEFAAEELAENMVLLSKEHGYYGKEPLEESNSVCLGAYWSCGALLMPRSSRSPLQPGRNSSRLSRCTRTWNRTGGRRKCDRSDSEMYI